MTDDDLVAALHARATTATPEGRVLAADLYGLGHTLFPHPRAGAVDVSAARRQGHVFPDGTGFVIDAYPYGGSVIEGYGYQMTAVLADGSVIRAEQHDLAPSATVFFDGSPTLSTL